MSLDPAEVQRQHDEVLQAGGLEALRLQGRVEVLEALVAFLVSESMPLESRVHQLLEEATMGGETMKEAAIQQGRYQSLRQLLGQ